MMDEALESFFEAVSENPVSAMLGIGMTLTWLRIMRELREAGLPWEDAVCVCIPSNFAMAGFVQGFDFARVDLAPEVVTRWDRREVVAQAVREGADAFGALLDDDVDDDDERLLGLAMYVEMLAVIPTGGAEVRAQGKDALGFALAILAAVEVFSDEQGFPVKFMGHGQMIGDDRGMSLAIPRLYVSTTEGQK